MPHWSPSRCCDCARGSQQTAVGHEQQRLGVVGLEELVAGQQIAVEPAALREPEQGVHHRRHRSEVAAHRDRATGARSRLGERVV